MLKKEVFLISKSGEGGKQTRSGAVFLVFLHRPLSVAFKTEKQERETESDSS